jgi:hypothetical protein
MIQLNIGKHWGDSYFRGQDFIQTHSHGTFLWILRPASSTQASQFTQTFPPSLSHHVMSSQPMGGGVAVPQGILTAAFSAGTVSQFTGDTQWSSGEGARSQVVAASTSESRDGLLTACLWQAGRQARFLDSGLSLYTRWWPHHPCYWYCHLRFSLFGYCCHLRFGLLAYQPVILWLVSKS